MWGAQLGWGNYDNHQHMEQLPVEWAELYVCAASCRHVYAPVATFQAAAAQPGFLEQRGFMCST